MISQKLEQLYGAYMQNQLTAGQKEELWDLLTDPSLEEEVKKLMDARFNEPMPALRQTDASAEAMFRDIITGQTPVRRIPASRKYWAVAALMLLLLGAGFYRFYMQPGTRPPAIAAGKDHDILPGREGAILTLANGNQVVLDSMGNTMVAVQNGTQVALQNGQLIYSPAADVSGAMTYNTISIPRGRQFRIVLPDGTKAWLNAASSLRYPVVFTGKERRLEVTGEAYFEVAKSADMPFFVKVSGGPEVKVLGTSFNINAYTDEQSVNTTVLTGSVQVSADVGAPPLLLIPGQQASLLHGGTKPALKEVDEEAVVAWKNGNFHFESADIQTIMRQLARWYDLEIVMAEIQAKKFSGTIPRNVPVSQVFKILESTNNVHFKISGNQVTVTQ